MFTFILLCFQEELAEGLHLIDFEQLKIENQTYNEKIEERNEVSMAPKSAASQARENESLVFGFTPDWLRKRHVHADWWKYVAQFFLPFLHFTNLYSDTLYLGALAF